MPRNVRRFSWLVILALTLGGCAGNDTKWHAKNIARLMPPLAFELTDESGNRVHAKDYRGRIVMLFFGYTHCPDYCPTTLSKLARVLDKLPDPMREDVRILFVSVDPKRDSPKNLAIYADNFAPEVIGLTGTEDELRDLAKRYRTTFSYGEPNERGNYTVSHGLAVYVFDRQGNATLMVLDDQSIEQIADDLRRLLST